VTLPLRLIPALFALLLLLVTPAHAQDETVKGFDFEAWSQTASRAEGIIESAQASSPALETLRQTLADFRAQALSLQDANQARIDTLESQLAALGPPPADGETEAEEVAGRRAELTDQLTQARAPVLAAQEAYRRADGMIGEVDRIIRDRISAQLFQIGPSPLNPTLWPKAAQTLGDFTKDVRGEIEEGLASQAQQVLTRQNLPLSLTFFVVGLLLLTRARQWFLRAVGLMPLSHREGRNDARAILISTTQIIIPLLGLLALERALVLTGLVGLRGSLLLDALLPMGLAVFGAIWLGRTLFTDADDTPILFELTDEKVRLGQVLSAVMGGALALDILLGRLAAQADFPPEAQVVLSFPIVLVAGITLVRMGLLLGPGVLATGRGGVAVPTENPLQSRIYRLLTRGVIFLGATGPLLAAIGYFTASTSFVFPAVKTLALLGALLVTYRLVTDLADRLLRSSGVARDEQEARPLTLVPVALGFSLILLGLPLLALIWGARVSDLREIWTLISEGFTLGGRRISFTDFLTFAIVFAVGYTATRLLQSTLRTTVMPRTTLDAGGRNAIVTGSGYIGIFLSAIAAISIAGFDLSSLAIVAGALSVGIGFGLQAIVSNFVSGIILLVERPIKEGDWIEVGAYSGTVRKISVRSTEIQTFDRATVVVPNADFISGTVTNWTHSTMNGRVKVPVGVAYDSDPREVQGILLEIAEGHEMVDKRFDCAVVFLGFGPDSMDFEIRAILRDVNNVLTVKSDMNFLIVERFRAAGIEIPFAQRDINLRNLDEVGETLKNAFNDKAK
jgi:potassium-dependent mechanosensitive channel